MKMPLNPWRVSCSLSFQFHKQTEFKLCSSLIFPYETQLVTQNHVHMTYDLI